MEVQEKKQRENLIDEEVADISTISDEPIEISEEAKQSEEELEKIAPVDSNQVLKTKSPSKKILIAIVFIAINLLAILTTVVIEFTGEEQPVPLSAVWNTFMENIGWGICGVLMFVCAILCDAIKRYSLLKTTLNKKLPLTCLKSTIICRYYDYITPLGSGGQPFEIYYLRKKGIPVGIASGVPIVGYALDRIAYVFVAIVTVIFYGFGDTSLFIRILCIVGLIANAFIPFAIFFFTVMPKVARGIANFVAKIAKKLRIIKDQEEFAHKITESIGEYASCLKYFTQKSKISILKGFVYSCLQFLALYSIPFFAVRMSGNYTASWGETFALCVICYTSVTLLPTPGNSGGAELSFRSIFASYLSGGLLFWGMLSWRIMSYYFYIIAGLTLILSQQIKKIIVYKRHPEKAKQSKEPLVHEPVENKQPEPVVVATANENVETPVTQNKAEEIDEDLTYVLPTKAISETEDIQFAETVIEAEATIEEEQIVKEEEVTPPDDAETVVNLELVIDPKNKTLVVENETLTVENETSVVENETLTVENEISVVENEENKPNDESNTTNEEDDLPPVSFDLKAE